MNRELPNLNPHHHSDVIQRALRSNRLGETEMRRLGRELGRVRDRLEAGEYRRNSFVGNTFNIPERMDDLLSELEFYTGLGRKWAHLISAVNLPRAARVIDLCPGLAPKVELGLYYYGFTGEVVACDIDETQLRRLQTFIGLFSVPFKTTYRCADIFTVQDQTCDAICGNHILDDLLLARAAQRLGVAPHLIYESEATLTSLCWNARAEGINEIREVAAAVVDLSMRVLNPSGVLILTHYASHVERIMGLSFFGEMVREVLKMCRRIGRERGLRSVRAHNIAASNNGGFAPEEVLILTKKT
jgi:hypothetical protein